MAPRPGGEADKIGNKYEAAWTIRHALYCILNSSRSLTLEDIDPDVGQGSEFTYVSNGVTEVHQLKRQNGNSNYWSIKSLASLGILKSAAGHVAAGRHYHFASLIPCGPLKELAERARQSVDLETFTQSWLTKSLRTPFDELSAAEVLGNAQAAWTALRGMWFEVHDEDDVITINAMLAELSLEGSTGHLMSLAVGDVLLRHLGRTLTRDLLLEKLSAHQIKPLSAKTRTTAQEEVVAVADSWAATVRRELLQPPIERTEVEQIIGGLGTDRLGLVIGTAGGGKSAVLEQTVSSLRSSGAEVLAFRLDRLEPFTSTIDLGRQLGMESSPAATLAVAADGRAAYLVIDQLDAVSLASGRMPRSFDAVMDLIGEALSVAGIRVVMACREFDVENDHRIRALAGRSDMRKFPVSALSRDAIIAAVGAMNLDPADLSATQLSLLQTPLNLVLLNSVADQPNALLFQSRGALFTAFWERKRQATKARRDRTRFNDVLARVANAASDRQVLSVPIEILDEGDLIDDANVLVSEHVLARDGDRIAFFHETFFDYAFARQWVSRQQSLVAFLLRDEQELFRRGQVRQILQHLHEREPERFLVELEGLLTSSDIRFHIKETAWAVFTSLTAPTSEEANLALRVAASNSSFKEHLWQQLSREQWFYRFHADGHLTTWLESGVETLETRALTIIAGGATAYGDDLAVLLEAHQDRAKYANWLRWAIRFTDVHANRRLFVLLLNAVRAGEFDSAEQELWLAVHELGNYQPGWAVELLQAYLIERDDALALDADGKVAALTVREYWASELVHQAASAEPLAFVQRMIPYLVRVMAATKSQTRENGLLADRHFTYRLPDSELTGHDFDDALFFAAVQALGVSAKSEPALIKPLLETLADNPYDAAQYLLYRALAAAGDTYASWGADLLLEGGSRLECGYISDGDWVARQLVEAISPHVGADAHRRLEDLFRDIRKPYESLSDSGHTAFAFLSALDRDRLTDRGKRRLKELQRKFREDAPPAPLGIRGGTVVSPIGDVASTKMTDDQWLGAMARYDKDEHDWETFKGGARELSHQFRARFEADPDRFSKLALRMTSDLHPAYGEAALIGMGNATVQNPEVNFAAIGHIASLDHAANDRWLGMALRHHYRTAPIDLVQLVLDRLLSSADPLSTSLAPVLEDEDRQASELHQYGINTARGSLAEALGDLLVYDTDGARTALVLPHLEEIASDPVLHVRSCVAHTIGGCLRYARPDAINAFQTLIEADDLLLATNTVRQLMLYIGSVNPEVINPVIHRMLVSDYTETREAGGEIAAFAALEWQRADLLDHVAAWDTPARVGVARVCVRRIGGTSNTQLAASVLLRLMNDQEHDVRKAVAEVAPQLRGQAIRPFADLLVALIDSPAYADATPQLLITLEHAPDKVDDLVLKSAQRFLTIYGEQAGDIRTSAAGDAHYISELVVRGLAQSSDLWHRGALLDVLDLLLELGVYGIGKAIAETERL